MDGLYWNTLLKWMIWGKPTIFGNTHFEGMLKIFPLFVASGCADVRRKMIAVAMSCLCLLSRPKSKGPENGLK